MLPSLGKFRDPKRRASEDCHGDAFGLEIIAGKERCCELNSDNILEIYVQNFHFIPSIHPVLSLAKAVIFSNKERYSSTGGSFNPQ